MHTVLVFGGSGFIGTHLLARLVAKNDISVVSADLLPPRRIIPGVTYTFADVRSLSDFEVPSGTTTIYNLAAVHTTPGHESSEYYDTNVRGAIEITRLATRHNIKEIIFTSSISVYGPGEETKSEDHPLSPSSDYGCSKRIAEEIHKSWAEIDLTRRLIIARPAVVFGAGERGNFTRMADLLKIGIFVFPGRRGTIKACIYVDDLLDALEFARHRLENIILFNGAYEQRYTIEQIVEIFRNTHFPRAKIISLPRVIVSIAVFILRYMGGSRFGFHPDRVMKLVQSTDIAPVWLSKRGMNFPDALENALNRWSKESGGQFD